MKFNLLLSSIALPAIFAFTMTSCDSANENPIKESESVAQEQSATEVPFSGTWMQESYYNLLKETNSPSKAQKLEFFKCIKIGATWQDDVEFIHNFHEGDNPHKLLKTNGSIFIVGSESADTLAENRISIVNDNEIKIGELKFIKVGSTEEFDENIVGKMLLSGVYSLDGQSVKFLDNNKLQGIGDFTYYKVRADYMDMGLNLDEIVLGKNEEDNSIYAFVIKDNKLMIYDKKCIDKEEDMCAEYALDKLKYEIKIN